MGRYYTDADQRRLERIGYFREAGLSLKEILPADEVERGRRWSRGEIDDY